MDRPYNFRFTFSLLYPNVMNTKQHDIAKFSPPLKKGTTPSQPPQLKEYFPISTYISKSHLKSGLYQPF